MSVERQVFRPGRVLPAAVALAAIGGFIFLVGMLAWRARTMVAYLAAYTFVAGLAVSALFLLMVFYLSSAAWPVAVRRLFENASAVFPLLLVLFVPIALDLDVLYPWFSPQQLHDEHARELIGKREAYLNAGFFLTRAGGYLLLWLALAELLRFWSLSQDEDISYPVWPRARVLSALGLPLVGISATFAAWDWMVSISAIWSSSVFGLYFLASGSVTAVAAVTVVARLLQRAGRLALTDSHYHALGRLLFGSNAFFMYIGWFQFFLVWEANVPDGVSWYVARAVGGWTWASVLILILGCTVLPLAALLPYRAKRSGSWLLVVALWQLVFQYLNFWWCVGPRYHQVFYYGWLEFCMLLFVGGLACAFIAWRMSGRDVAPRLDPLFPKAMEYRSP